MTRSFASYETPGQVAVVFFNAPTAGLDQLLSFNDRLTLIINMSVEDNENIESFEKIHNNLAVRSNSISMPSLDFDSRLK